MSITEDRPSIEAVRALESFIAKDGRGEHLLTFQGILRSHEALRAEAQAYHDRAVTAEGTAREALTRAAALANGLAALPETPTTDDAGESQHDHVGEPRLWCETHQHTHIASVPRFTYLCKDCGWGQWYGDQAREHEAWAVENLGQVHTTYEVEHVMRPLPSPPTEEQPRTVTFANERQVEALFAESSDHEMVFVNAINDHLIVGLSEDGECFYQGVPEALNEEGTEVDQRRGWLRNLRELEWPLTLMVKAEEVSA